MEVRETKRRIERAEAEIAQAREGAEVASRAREATSLPPVLAADLTGAPDVEARADRARAERAEADAHANEARARRALEQAHEDLERAQKRGRHAEEAARDAAQAAARALGALTDGSPAAALGPAGSAALGVGTKPVSLPGGFTPPITGGPHFGGPEGQSRQTGRIWTTRGG